MSSYYLGIDIGGTKSHALLADETGRVLGFGRTGPGNHEVVGFGGLAEALHAVTAQALHSAGVRVEEVRGAGFGVAGYDWPYQLAPTQAAIAALKLECPRLVVNDALIGLLAGAAQGWGVAVVGGTGCNCWGWDRQRRIGRVTGCGHLFGEYGGGGDIGLRAVQAAAYQWTRRGPATALTTALMEYTGARDVEEMLEGLAQEQYGPLSAAAPLVFDAARQGDPIALEIVLWAAEQLGALAAAVIRQLELQALDFEVVLVGSLFKAGPLLVEPLRQLILKKAPCAELVQLAAPPVIGGVLLGMEAAGLAPGPQRARLIETYPHHP